MGLSATQRIIEVLQNTDYPLSIDEIAHMVGVDAREVIKSLDRIESAMKRKGYEFEIEAAYCKKCGFTFERSLKVPSKCPRCHSQWLSPPRFRLVRARQ